MAERESHSNEAKVPHNAIDPQPRKKAKTTKGDSIVVPDGVSALAGHSPPTSTPISTQRENDGWQFFKNLAWILNPNPDPPIFDNNDEQQNPTERPISGVGDGEQIQINPPQAPYVLEKLPPREHPLPNNITNAATYESHILNSRKKRGHNCKHFYEHIKKFHYVLRSVDMRGRQKTFNLGLGNGKVSTVNVRLAEDHNKEQTEIFKDLVSACKVFSDIQTELRTAEENDKHASNLGSMVGVGTHYNEGHVTTFKPGRYTKGLWEKTCAFKGWKFDKSKSSEDIKLRQVVRTLESTKTTIQRCMTDIFGSWPYFSDMVNRPGGGVWKKVLPGVEIQVPRTYDISRAYNPSSHFDPNDATHSFAIWLQDQSEKDDRERRWFFLFPEHSLAIELEHGMCISWEGDKVRHCSISLVKEEGKEGKEGKWISDPDMYSLFTSSCKDVVEYFRVLNAALSLVNDRQTLKDREEKRISEEEGTPVVWLLPKEKQQQQKFEYGRIFSENEEGKAPSGSAWFKKGLKKGKGFDYCYELVNRRRLVRKADIDRLDFDR